MMAAARRAAAKVTDMSQFESCYDQRPFGPLRLKGKVVPGFKRGSKLLGFPTANLDPEGFKGVVSDEQVGVYACFAQVNGGLVYPGVLSIGYNPTFGPSSEMTVETYILNLFEKDFYGSELRLVITSFMRPMVEFGGFELLIKAIQRDVEVGSEILAAPETAHFAQDPFFAVPRPK